MADKTIPQLPAAAAAATTQLLEVVTDPSGTPVSQKLSIAQLITLLDTRYPTKTVSVANGGTGVTAFGGTNTLLYTSAANVLTSLANVVSAALVTSGTGVISWASGAALGGQVLKSDGTNLAFGLVQLTASIGQGVTGTLGATNGGTAQTAVTTGDLLFGQSTNIWARLAGVATGNALISGGIATAPSWGKIGLTTHVSGILPIANGGTGSATLAGANIVTTSTISFDNGIARFDGASGNVIQGSVAIINDSGNLTVGGTTDGGTSGIYVLAVNSDPPAVGSSSSTAAIKIESANTLAYATGASNNSPFPIWYQTYGTNGAGPYPIVFNPVGGGIGVGLLNCSAILHVAGGDDTAGASLKFEPGTLLSSPQDGAMEYDGTNLFFTRTGSVREGVLTQSAVTTEVIVSDTSVTVNIGGATLKLLARA